jgi:hypothetical protein
MTEYTYQLNEAELARYRAMAAHPLAHESTLWTRRGHCVRWPVVDLGCGPGTFLADRAGRSGGLSLQQKPPTPRKGLCGPFQAKATLRSLAQISPFCVPGLVAVRTAAAAHKGTSRADCRLRRYRR